MFPAAFPTNSRKFFRKFFHYYWVAIATSGSWLRSGDVVEVNWDDVWWPCDVLQAHMDSCTVKYHDGGDVEDTVEVAERARRPQKRYDAWLNLGKWWDNLQKVYGFTMIYQPNLGVSYQKHLRSGFIYLTSGWSDGPAKILGFKARILGLIPKNIHLVRHISKPYPIWGFIIGFTHIGSYLDPY